MVILCETKMRQVVNCDMTRPEDDPMVMIAEALIDFIFRYGAPKEILNIYWVWRTSIK